MLRIKAHWIDLNKEFLITTKLQNDYHSCRRFSIMERYKRSIQPNQDILKSSNEESGAVFMTKETTSNMYTKLLPNRSVPKEVQFPTWTLPVQPDNPHSLKVAILGPPNAGKSSLLNALTNSWLSSVSPKVNTTNSQIRGILTEENSQLVFIDSPGIIPSHSKKNFSRTLLSSAWRGYEEADLCLLIIDCVKRPSQQIFEVVRMISPKNLQGELAPSSSFISTSTLSSYTKSVGLSPATFANRLSLNVHNNNNSLHNKANKNSYGDLGNHILPPICLILNKVDLVSQPKWIKSRLKEFEAHGEFDSIFYISAKRKSGLEKLKRYLKQKCKPSPWQYPSDMITPLSKLEQVEQLIRTYLFCWFNKDVPYKITQKTLGWTEDKHKIIIEQELNVIDLGVKKMICGIRNRLLFQLRKNVMYKLSLMWSKAVMLNITIKIEGKRDK